MSVSRLDFSNSELWNGNKSFKDTSFTKENDFQANLSKISNSVSPRSTGTPLSMTPYSPSTPSSHQSWERALTEVVGVLRIQYRNDNNVMAYLTDPDKIKQLQYSTAAKMEWNRRVIKEERDAGVYCPTRSRRLAKEVAIDYVRRYLDGEEERGHMMKKIQILETEKDQNLVLIADLEKHMKRFKEENETKIEENAKLIEEMLKLRKEIDSLTTANETLRDSNSFSKEENINFRKENAVFRDENNKLRNENQAIRDENGALRNENQKVRHDNDKLRANSNEIRAENSKLREENQELRDENLCVRCESLKYRENNVTLRDDNDRLRAKNEDMLNDNKTIIKENLELRSKLDELKILINAQLVMLTNGPKIRESEAALEDKRNENERR